MYFEDNSEPAQHCPFTFDFNNEEEDKASVVPAACTEFTVPTDEH